jgi:hypothetical protein
LAQWPEPMAFKPERFIDVDTTLPSGINFRSPFVFVMIVSDYFVCVAKRSSVS